MTLSEVDLSDLPADLDPKIVEEIRAARLKSAEAHESKLHAEAVLRDQKSIGLRLRAWAQDDTIGRELALAFTPRGG